MSIASDTAVIVVAAGRGTRMGAGLPKQWRPLCGRPVVAHALDAFRAAGLARLLLVIHPEDGAHAARLGVTVVTGGATRTGSVRAALNALTADPPAFVLIHDAARPLVAPALIAQVLDALQSHVAAAPALALSDALWRGDGGFVSATHDRSGLWRAQTPQGFRFDALLAAYRDFDGEAADDVAVVRAAGQSVWITAGSEDNLKITYPVDLERAERLLIHHQTFKDQTMDIRTGNGFDVHAFTSGDHLWLCGVRLAHDRALKGHSDADVGMHALTDALYGALAEGDIGRHFPPSDPQWRGAASHIFLRHAAGLARARGYTLANADVTLICEQPKIGPHAGAMQATLAQILQVEAGRVSVKATTSERLGFTGREEGIAALATATLVQSTRMKS